MPIRPVLTRNVIGSLTRETTQLMIDGAALAMDNAPAIDAAKQLLLPGQTAMRFLAKFTAATAMGGTYNRYLYTGEPMMIDYAHDPQLLTDSWGEITDAINISELRNTETELDGTPLPDGATAGPFGSSWTGSAWTTSGLNGYAECCATFRDDGTLLFWFDKQLPIRCEPPE